MDPFSSRPANELDTVERHVALFYYASEELSPLKRVPTADTFLGLG